MNRLNDSAFNIAVLQTAGISNIIQQLVKIYLKKNANYTNTMLKLSHTTSLKS